MAKKKYTQKKLHATLMLVGCLAVLLLGILGVQLPETIQDFFGVQLTQSQQDTAKTTSQSGTNPGPIENGSASFTASELKDTGKSWITYHSLDSLGRATGADALLKKERIGTGTPANSDIRPVGFISGLDPYYHSRGHLIGRQLGGSGDKEENLVTLYQNPVNTPYMTKYENMIRAALEKNETVRYRVTPVYSGDQLMCTKIKLEAKSLQKNGSIDFNVLILNER